jgi:hypothetical protein
MGPSNPERAKSGPDGDLGAAIAETFGSFQSFQEQFTKSAVGLFGSGFVYLVRDRKSGGQLAIKQYPNQDTPVMDGELPIVGLDVWEHALVATNTLLYRMPLSFAALTNSFVSFYDACVVSVTGITRSTATGGQTM